MVEIQKANALPQFETDNFILVGPAGGGKSTLSGTLPGKTLVVATDVSARAAYRKFRTDHIDIVEFMPEEKDLTPYTIKDMATRPLPAAGQHKEKGDTFLEIGKFLNSLSKEGKLPGEYRNIVTDSITTLQEFAIDSVMAKEGRAGQIPQMNDYMSQMRLINKYFDTLCRLPINVVFLLHDEMVQDETTKKILYSLMLTGKSKARLPNKVNHLIRCSAKSSIKGTSYFIQTSPDSYSESIRTSYEGLNPKHDVTIEDFSKPWEYGLGKIIQEQKKLWTK